MIQRADGYGPPDRLGGWADLLGGRLKGADESTPVRALADDSRAVTRGAIFFARRGAADDGRRYVADAHARGAVAVVADAELSSTVPLIRVHDVAYALRVAADAWYERPQDDLDLVGITGTKGKTTTAWLAAAALRQAGVRTALFGTIAHEVGDGTSEPATNTTPGTLELRRLLAAARDRGARAAVMEVSSHALDQGRVAGLDFRAAVFTNLGRDHLDYHDGLDAYFAAKARLFQDLGVHATAVVNREDERWWQLQRVSRGRVLGFGEMPEADLRAHDIRLSAVETRFALTIAGERQIDVTTPLVGRHNVMNLVAAVGAVKALGVDVVEAARGASGVTGVPGRLERIRPSGDLNVFVDYAHTEEALREVLTFLTELGGSSLVCVVGCGGDRDRTKRPLMARAAAELAETAVLTSDNPRTEDPLDILGDMVAGLDEADRQRVLVEPDRREAIRRAVLEARPGACVVIAGKGHETYQIQGTEKIPFDDAKEVRAALALRLRALERVE